MKTSRTYNKAFNVLRITFLCFAALMFAGSVLAISEGIKTDNMEQVINGTITASVAIAAPAVADPNVRKSLMKLGFMGGGGLSRDEQTLLAFLEGSSYVDKNTLEAYRGQKVRFVDANYFFRKEITGMNGTKAIVDETLNKKIGITNVHMGKLQKGENAVISQIVIGYATDAAIVDSSNLVYDSVVTGWPTGLANGLLHIKQDGAYLIDPLPISLCGSQADSTAARGHVDSKQLRTPFIMEEEKQIVIEIEFAQAVPANKHHVEIYMLGSKTRVRSNK